MRGKVMSAAWIALGALGLSACSDSGTEPDFLAGQVASAAAAVAADAVLGDLAEMDGVVPQVGGAAQMASYDLRERTVTFFDLDGAEQEAFDPIATASIHTVVRVEGEISRENISASVERARDLWVTGLEGEEESRTWNGQGSSHHERVQVNDELGERNYKAEAESIIEEVVRSVDREANPWPLSDTITRSVKVKVMNGPNGDQTRERTVVIAFDGTQFPTLWVDGAATADVDLATRGGRNPLRRRGG